MKGGEKDVVFSWVFGSGNPTTDCQFLLTALVFITTSRLQRKRETLLRIKEDLVFFGIVGAGLWTALHYDLHHSGNNIPSGVLASILIEVWVFMPRWARLSTPDSPKASWLQL